MAVPWASPTFVCANTFEHVLTRLSSFFSLILPSPPYNVGKPYEKKQPLLAYCAPYEALIAHFARVLKPNGSVAWQAGRSALRQS
jgi:adenine-specific DNA-methyltransferase